MNKVDVSLGGPTYSTVDGEGTVTIADATLLLSGSYSRDGDDLVLTGQNGEKLQIVEYFAQPTPPALISSDGQMLSGDTVTLLAGPQAPAQYAQTGGGGLFGPPIGVVDTLSGTASAQRANGLKVELEIGGPVFQGDVVSAGPGATLGITFIDKTVFALEDGATMVLNEMVYNPGGSSNSMLFNLIDGTAAFIAGGTAKDGDMKVETPVAVMAIRGTTPMASCNAAGGQGCAFGGKEGIYDLLDKLQQNVIATVDNPDLVITIRSIGGAPSISSPNPQLQQVMGKLFSTIQRTLDQRSEEGELDLQFGLTGSPDFSSATFIESIGGFISNTVATLLGKEAVEQDELEPNSEFLTTMPEPTITGSTDEDNITIVEVITEDDVLGLGMGAMVIAAVVTQGLGTATVSADGTSVIYDPGVAYNHLSMGETESVRISILIELADGSTQTEIASVTVLGVNDMPTANPDDAGTNQNAAVAIDVLANDTDPDTNDDLTVTSAVISSGSGLVSVAGDGLSITYDPNGAYDQLAVGESVSVVIAYEISDGNGGSSSSTATVIVTGTNEQPDLTIAPAGAVQEDVAVDAGGALKASGAISVSDTDTSDTHIVTPTYNGDATWSGGVLTPLQIAAVSTNFTADTGGWAYEVSNAAVQFLAAGETVTLSYLVTATDSSGAANGSDAGVVTITIQGTNDQPQLTVDTSGGVVEDSDVVGDQLSDSGSLSFSDVDVSDTHSVSSSFNNDAVWSAGALTPAQVTEFAAGFSADETGWTYDIANASVQFLGAGETIELSFDVTVTDSSGAGNDSDTETVSIIITGNNDRPNLTVTTSGSVEEDVNDVGGQLSDSGALNITDKDATDTHDVTFSYNNDAAWTGGTLSAGQIAAVSTGFNADAGGWTYDVANAAVQFIAEGETIALSFDVTATDDSGAGNNSDTETVTITITGGNDQPQLTVDTSGGVLEDDADKTGQLTDSGELSFTDADSTDTHGVSFSYNNDASWSDGTLNAGQIAAISGGFSVDASGWSYSIANSAVQFLGAGETIELSFDVTVTDSSGAGNDSDTETVTLLITGRNDKPQLTVDTSGSVQEDVNVVGGMVSDTGSLSFTDADSNDSHDLSFSYNDDATWSDGVLTASQVSKLVSAFSIDGSGWTYELDNSDIQFLSSTETVTLSFDVTVNDDSGAGNSSDTKTVFITIEGTNDAPVVTGDTEGEVEEDIDVDDGILSDSGVLMFEDVDASDIDTLTFSYNNDAEWSGGTLSAAQITAISSGFTANSTGWVYEVANSAVQFLGLGEVIVLSFDVTVTDDAGPASDTETIFITIVGRNDRPVLTVETTGNVEENFGVVAGMVSDSGTLSFTDRDTNDTHDVSSSYNGDASWTGGALSAAQIAAVSSGFTADGSGWTYEVANSALQFLAKGEQITLSFDVTVTDDSGAGNNDDTETVTITITGRNDQPQLTVDTSGGVVENEDVVAGQLSDSGTLSFTDVDTTDTHMVISSYNGDAAWTGGALNAAQINAISSGFSADETGWDYTVSNPAVQFLGAGEEITLSFDVSVIDDSGAFNDTDTETVTITITGKNDRPVLTVDTSGGVQEDVDVSGGTLSDSGSLSIFDRDTNDTHLVTSSYNEDAVWTGGTLSAGRIAAISTGFSADETGWTYDVSNAALQFLAAGQTITLSFDVLVTDDSGASNNSDTETVTIVIEGTNDDPTLSGTTANAQEDGSPITVNLAPLGSDVDNGENGSNLTYTIVGGPAEGSASISGTTLTFDPGSDFQDLAAGATRTVVVQIEANDGSGGTSNVADVEITVSGVNDVAVISGDDTGQVTEDDEVDTVTGQLNVVDPDIRQDGTVEAAFTAAVIMGTYGVLTLNAAGAWSYALDNSLDTTDGLVSGDSVTDSFTVSTIDGTTHEINITVEGVGFDFEFADFGGNSGSSDFKSIDAGDIESIDIDLLITPMPLTIISGGDEIPNKVNATKDDLGVGAAQDIASDEGLRFEFITEGEAMNQNNISALAYSSHISLVLFQAKINDIQGDQSQTASIQIRIVNADDDNNFDTLADGGDVVIPLSVDDVHITVASGNLGNITMQQFGDTVLISGLQEEDIFTIESPTPFNRVEIENASDLTGSGNAFELGLLGFNMPDELLLVGDGSNAPLIGGDGNDTLNSGPGQQELTGGRGIDMFVFDGTASTGALADIITDYTEGADIVDLTELFDVAPGDFTEAAVEEFARYLSSNENDVGTDPAGNTGDLFIDVDGAANGENFVLLAHSQTATESLLLKVDDGNDVNYVTIV